MILNRHSWKSLLVSILLLNFAALSTAQTLPALDSTTAWILDLPGGDPLNFEAVLLFHVSPNAATTTTAVTARLLLNNQFQTSGPQERQATAYRGSTGIIRWPVKGRRVAGEALVIDCNGMKVPVQFTPSIQPIIFTEKSVLAPHEKTSVRIRLLNSGIAWSKPGIKARIDTSPNLRAADGLQKTFPESLPPGDEKTIQFSIEAFAPGPASVKATVDATDGTTPTQQEIPLFVRLRGYQENSPGISLGRDGLRLTVLAEGSNYGALSISRAEKNAEPTLALCESLGLVAWRDSQGSHERRLKCKPDGATSVSLKLTDKWQDDDGATWHAQVTLRILNHLQAQVDCRLGVNNDRKLLAFRGPWLRAGEGSTGAKRDSAMFPGIEWLNSREVSSAYAYPAEISFPGPSRPVPHPNKITIPLMSVTNGGQMVGIEWDPLQKWDGEHDRPASIFSSPNQIEHADNHLMGLFLPSVPQWVDENNWEATKPYPLKANQELRLRFKIFAAPVGNPRDDLAPIRYWFAEHGIPQPAPLSRPVHDELKFWNFGGTPVTDVLDYQNPRTLVERPQELIAQARNWVKLQQPDGAWTHSWDFDPGPAVLARLISANAVSPLRDSFGYYTISHYGTPGDTTIGTCTVEGGIGGLWTSKAITVIRAARLTGADDLMRAAHLALKRMEKFDRPEGAQAWEQPLHSPDLLAVAYGMRAFLEGFRLTGDKHWLDLAEKWAWKGMPFIWTWAPRDMPQLYYGTLAYIPLCGAAVTWNGIEYAQSIFDLSHYRPDCELRPVAVGITHWTLKTIRPGAHAWPDMVTAMTGEISPPDWKDDRPGRVLAMNEGLVVQPETTITHDPGGKEVRITGEAIIRSAQWRGDTLILNLNPVPHGSLDLAIAGVSQNQKVMVGDPPHLALSNRTYLEKEKLLLLSSGN